ncbi:Tripeptidyl aminopeptidase [Streptomyces sp. RB5]|uniref:Tripeptidyl aminopeptidase n=1 Tax=Streptomyces smaragdinus TaxID=2585196 RepID=A0A7K0CQ03_9ACTN|nr:Tripeptidyl aminopeptidase [Streptomyces smaragdinus]
MLYGILGSLALTGLATAPADSHPQQAARHGVEVAAEHAERAGITFGDCPESEDLPKAVRCGTVNVPLDYADPDGEQLELLVSHTPATGPKRARLGALVFNPGGPGGSGTYFPLLSRLPEWQKLARAYDFTGYAPRGVTPNAPLSCQHPDEFGKAPSNSPQQPTAHDKAAGVEDAKAYAAGCAANRGIEHYTSLNNARDLEVLRAALRQPKLNYLGASYGTYFGALYATLFPERVGRFVFDSAVDPTPRKIWYENNLIQSLAFENRWSDFRRWVAKHDNVYGLGRTEDAVARSYDRVRTAVEKEPAGGKVGSTQLQAAFLRTGYADDFWPTAATALAEYAAGRPAALVDFAAPAPEERAAEENGNAVYTAVECNDAAWPTDFAVWDRDNTRLAVRAPFETWDNVWMNLPCAYWKAPRQRPADVRTAPGELPPVLVLAAERDAATPYEGSKELHRRLAGSTLITERGSGSHGIAGGPNPCVNGHVDAYFLHGTVPDSDASCGPHPEPKAKLETPEA